MKYGQRPGGYVWLNNDKTRIRAHIEMLSGYSAHADQQGLFDWVALMPEKPERIKLVHGDPAAQKELRKKLINAGHNVNEID